MTSSNIAEWRAEWARRDNWTRFCMSWVFTATVIHRKVVSCPR